MPVIKLVVNSSFGDGSLIQNVFHYNQLSVGPFNNDNLMDDVQTFINAWIADTWQDFLITAITFDFVEGWLVDNADVVLEYLGIRSLTGGGTGASDGLPHQMAYLVQAPTGFPRVVGRKYLGGGSEAGQNNGVPTTSVLTTLGNWALEYVANQVLDSLTWEAGVVSSKQGGFVPFGTTIILNTLMATQHQRKQGIGV